MAGADEVSREEFDALLERVAMLEARLSKPRRTGPPVSGSSAGRPKVVLSTLASRDTLEDFDADVLVLTTDTFTMWRREGGSWIRKPLPVCDFCEFQAVVAVPLGDPNIFKVTYGCSEHRERLIEDHQLAVARQAKWTRQRDELWER